MEYLILSSLFFAFNNVLWKWIVADYLPLQVIVKRSMITSFIGISFWFYTPVTLQFIPPLARHSLSI